VVKDTNRKYYKDFREIDLSLGDITITRYVSWYEEDDPGQSEVEFTLAKQLADSAQG
jgi:hypothetical protein